MIIGTGLDIIEVERIENAMSDAFLKRVFSEREREKLLSRKNSAQTAAGMWAAKEAVAKALGTGFGSIDFKEAEVLSDGMNRPYIELSGRALEYMESIGGAKLFISITHIRQFAAAHAILCSVEG